MKLTIRPKASAAAEDTGKKLLDESQEVLHCNAGSAKFCLALSSPYLRTERFDPEVMPHSDPVSGLLKRFTNSKEDIWFRRIVLLYHNPFVSSQDLLNHFIENFKTASTFVRMKVLSILHEWLLLYYETDLEGSEKRIRETLLSPSAVEGLSEEVVAEQNKLHTILHIALGTAKREKSQRLKQSQRRASIVAQKDVSNSEGLQRILGRSDTRVNLSSTDSNTNLLSESSLADIDDNEDDDDENAEEKEEEKDDDTDWMFKLSAQEIAKYLQHVDASAFASLAKNPRELVAKKWTKTLTDGSSGSPNVMALIDQYNERTFWAASMVLSKEKENSRANTLKRMIHVAYKCWKMGNWYSAFALFSGISLSPVGRLKKTWFRLPKKTMKRYHLLQNVLDGKKNYSNYRGLLQKGLKKREPMLPHLALLLKDLFQLEEIPTINKEENAINFHKYTKQWQQVSIFLQFQMYVKQAATEQPESHSKLEEEYKKSVSYNLDEEGMWERSQTLEPRQPKAV